MDDATLYSTWHLWLAIGGVIVLAAAGLLLLVNAAAARILKLAGAALGIVKEIKENTKSIWQLENTNAVAGNVLNEAKSIDDHLSVVAKALHDLDQKKN